MQNAQSVNEVLDKLCEAAGLWDLMKMYGKAMGASWRKGQSLGTRIAGGGPVASVAARTNVGGQDVTSKDYMVDAHLTTIAQQLSSLLQVPYPMARNAVDKLWARSRHPMALESLDEQQVRIKVKHPGILKIDPAVGFAKTPTSHFIGLANTEGYAPIVRAVNNLRVWNKNNKQSETYKKAVKVFNALKKAKDSGEIKG